MCVRVRLWESPGGCYDLQWKQTTLPENLLCAWHWLMLSSGHDQDQPHRQGGNSDLPVQTAEGGSGFISRFAWSKASVLVTSPYSPEGMASKILESCPSEGLCCYSPDLEGGIQRGKSLLLDFKARGCVCVCLLCEGPSTGCGEAAEAGMRRLCPALHRLAGGSGVRVSAQALESVRSGIPLCW